MNTHHRLTGAALDERHAATRAALYMRVSTGCQAEHDLSIPDQRSQLKSWCRAHDYEVAAEFIEAGASAGDDRRPVFQQMIERACDGEHAFDLIVVHSYSRFFREAFEQEFYLRKLAKHDVKVVSITQPVGDETEPVHTMMRKVIALFDEYQSKENAKHVIRSMKENARQGFWNGATVPLGYKLVEAEKRGAKIKRKLAVDPVEAETVRLIFKLYLYGDGTSGALGIKEIVKWLNARGYRTRRSNSFGVGHIHKLLTNTIYVGRWRFNQTSSKTHKRKAANEIVETPPVVTLQCSMAEVVSHWIRDDVAPTLDSLGMPLRGIETLELFGCRSFNGISGAKLSEHGHANALDVRLLKLANGTIIELTNATVSKSLREQLRQTACTRFSTVLGNGADAYHENHVHIDLMQRTNNYKNLPVEHP